MNKNDEAFDVNQGHGDHNDCLFPSESNDDASLLARVKSVIASGTVVAGTKDAVPCFFGTAKPQMLPVIYISGGKGPVNLMTVICVWEKGRKNTFVSAYPECDGVDVKVRLTEIHEWANGIEATLEGTVLGDIGRDIAFFDTRYALRKGKYEIGKEYTFRIAALAYGVEIIPEAERTIKIEGQRAEEIRKSTGMKPEFNDDGSVKPIEIDQTSGVAYWSKTARYPDDAFFQSPVFSRVTAHNAFDSKFLRLEIGIARDDGDSDAELHIPLYAREEMFSQRPVKGDPVRGSIWLHGYCKTAEENEDPGK